jgi:acetyltransferase
LSVRNLEHLFRPSSIAVIGASDRQRSLGALVMRNLLAGGFPGPLWPVNPKHDRIAGLRSWPDVQSLPEAPDMAVVCTPAAAVPEIITQLGAKGTRAAIVISAGLKGEAAQGQPDFEQAVRAAARPFLLRVLGPNCLGLLVPELRLNASFAHAQALPGQLAFVSQSGALATALLDWANTRAIGFSHFISLGDSVDVDVGDVLDYLASDGATRAVLMYLESVRSARKFMSAARAAARNKPVIVVKAGRAPEGARAAASHTGALAGSDAVFDAAIRRAGMLRVHTLDDLFDAAETLARAKPLRGERLGIITNGGGAGVLAADALSIGGGKLAQLSAATRAELDRHLPAIWSRANPVDMIGDAPIERYTGAVQVLLQAGEVDAVLFMHAPTAVVPSADIAAACLPLLSGSAKTVLTCWLGGSVVAAARKACDEAGVPTYDSPERAVAAFLRLVEYTRNQQALLQVPTVSAQVSAPDREAARRVVDAALAQGREWLDETQAKALLAAYGIPVVATRAVRNGDQAAAAAAQIGYPVVLKIASAQISHKSDVGGVALNLQSEAEVRAAASAMEQRVHTLRPDAQLAGFTVQAFVRRAHAHELIVGVATDPLFGPTVLFGQGGTAVEVLRDRAVALPPLNDMLAHDLVARTRVAALLAGYRDRAAVDLEALCVTLQKVSQLVCDCAELTELDINPLLADEQGVLALDARVRLKPWPGRATDRLAILPYPGELEESVEFEGAPILLRPIRPEDGWALRSFYANATPTDMRLRFFLTRREVPLTELARYSQVDYDREMAFVAMRPGAGDDSLIGEARVVCDPDNERAEFAIQVRSGLQGKGLGGLLLDKLVRYLKARGTRTIWGECLHENRAMAALARHMGFRVERGHADHVLVLRRELA